MGVSRNSGISISAKTALLKTTPLKRQAFAGSQYRHGLYADLHRIYQGQELSDGSDGSVGCTGVPLAELPAPSGETSYLHTRRASLVDGMLCRWTFREERTFLTAGKDTTAHRVGGE